MESKVEQASQGKMRFSLSVINAVLPEKLVIKMLRQLRKSYNWIRKEHMSLYNMTEKENKRREITFQKTILKHLKT